jgi:succinyl-diaminopimelate desuccinylase
VTQVEHLLDDLADHEALSQRSLAQTLSRLVRAASVNPGTFESKMAESVCRELDGTGCTITVVEFAPGRPSVAAVLGERTDGPSLVLNGHMDTVPIGDRALWTDDPFGGVWRDGAVWGRGALDMKGGLTSQIACARVLASYRERLRGRLILHFVSGEECGEPGTLSLIENGFVGDAGIVTEPTALAVATAMRGVVYHTIRIVGTATHAGTPDAGHNPITPLAQVVDALQRYDSELQARRRHPLIGTGRASVTGVRAGVEHNAIPDVAEITVDRRMIPGETPESVHGELSQLVSDVFAGSGDYGWTVERLHHPFTPVEIATDSPLARETQSIAEDQTGRPVPIIGTPYGSDVRNLVLDAGMEAITFGAGDVSLCHCPNEHLRVEDLQAAATVITRVAAARLLER